MRTVKIVGSGPFFGKTFYGEIKKFDNYKTLVELDEKPPNLFNRVVLSTSSGMLLDENGGETDLLHVPNSDMITWKALLGS